MFLFKKIVSAFLMPVPLGLFLLLIAFLYLLSNSYTKAKVYLFLGLSWFVLLSYTPIANMIIQPLEDSHKALLITPDVEYILVLGSGHRTNKKLSITSQVASVGINRLVEGIRLHNLIPNSKLVVSGYGGKDINAHALMQEKLSLSLGVKKEDIIRFDTTKDTRLEAVEMKKLIGNKKFILVTSASHMKRSMLLFQKEGLNPIAAPTYHLAKESKAFILRDFSGKNLSKVEAAFHEYLGIIWAYIRGII